MTPRAGPALDELGERLMPLFVALTTFLATLVAGVLVVVDWLWLVYRALLELAVAFWPYVIAVILVLAVIQIVRDEWRARKPRSNI